MDGADQGKRGDRGVSRTVFAGGFHDMRVEQSTTEHSMVIGMKSAGHSQ